MKPQDDISINPGATYPNLNNLDGSPFFAWRQYKHADEICPCGS
ncbi:small toxic membrane polypeptide HokE, partial [Escherichia coli]